MPELRPCPQTRVYWLQSFVTEKVCLIRVLVAFHTCPICQSTVQKDNIFGENHHTCGEHIVTLPCHYLLFSTMLALVLWYLYYITYYKCWEDNLKYTGRCMKAMWKQYAALHEDLEYSWGSDGNLEPVCSGYQGTTQLLFWTICPTAAIPQGALSSPVLLRPLRLDNRSMLRVWLLLPSLPSRETREGLR